MRFEFSLQSLEQIKLHSISKEIVEIVLNEPDEMIIDEYNQQVFQKIIKIIYTGFLSITIKTHH